MAATWKPDVLKGNRGSYARDARGIPRLTVYESGLVTGLTGGGSEIMTEAIDVAAVPKLDSSHPTLTDLALDQIDPEVLGQKEVRLTLVYRERVKDGDEPVSIEYGASLQQTQVNTAFDANGDQELMPIDFTIDAVSQGVQYAFASVQLAGFVRTYTWRQEEDPADDCEYYTGKINPYNLFKEGEGLEGDVAKWLCHMTARSGDGGESWDVTAQFFYKENTWFADLVWIDPATNRPPAGLTFDNGREIYICHLPADMRDLALPGMLSG